MNGLTIEQINETKKMCQKMRINALKMAYSSGDRGAHISGSLSCIEIYAVLYKWILNYDIDNHLWEKRDRMVAGKEHARLAEFPAMAEIGFFPECELEKFESNDGLLTGHPKNLKIGLEYSSCSLGTALPFALGKALYAKQFEKEYKVFVLVGDAECAEGAIWEAIMVAAQYKLDNLTLIVDRNYLSVDGNTEELMAQRDMEEKFRAFGWASETVDGHDIVQLYNSLNRKCVDMPHVIIATTIKGKGVSFMENRKEWHQAILNEEDYKRSLDEVSVKLC